MKKTATIKDIAKRAGVSVATVSRYLNESGYVEESTKEKIAEVIKKLDYRPNRLAQGLKTRASKNVVLIVPDIQNPFYSTMAVTAQQLLRKNGYTVTLFNTYGDTKLELDSIHTVQDIGADGIIYASTSMNHDCAKALKKIDLPIVAVNVSETGFWDIVEGDAGESTWLSTKHLIEMGHTRIAFAGAALNDSSIRNRKKGYIRAMEEAGLPVCEEYIFEMGQILNSDAGIKAGYYFSALPERPTAICCSNDLLALGVYQAFYQLDIKIPEDISVTGVDDIMYANLCNPRLTTVTNDSEEYAKVAVQALLERIEKQCSTEGREYKIDRHLVVRDSVKRYMEIPVIAPCK